MLKRDKAIIDALQKEDWKGILIYDEGSKSMVGGFLAQYIGAVVLGVTMEGLKQYDN